MTPADHLRLLGPANLAEMRRRGAEAPVPPPDVIVELRKTLAPAMARVEARTATASQQIAA